MVQFHVTLMPSDHQFDAVPDQNILQTALTAGFAVPYSCRAGNCRTCRGKVISGTVDHAKSSPQVLTETDKADGFALLCQARPLSDLVIEVAELSGLTKPRILPARVMRIEKPAPDVAIIELLLPPREPIYFVAGQYIEILLEDGKRRAYSIANSPKPEGVGQIQLHVRHTPGGLFTDRVFTTMKQRELVKIEAPLGTFVLREESASPIVFVAAGTGFGPIKSIVESALLRRIIEQRPMTLYWGARTRADLYMLDLPLRWANEEPNFTFVPVLSEPTAGCDWTGRTGFVHQAVLEDLPDLGSHHVYACGTPAMVEAAKRDFRNLRGLPDDAFFADEFLTELDRLALSTDTSP